MSDWTQITCVEFEEILAREKLSPISSCNTDLAARFGSSPQIDTWGYPDGERIPVLLTIRYPARSSEGPAAPNRRPCEHRKNGGAI